MSYFVSKMRLKEQAEEDIWFARHEQELLSRVRQRRSEPSLAEDTGSTGDACQPPRVEEPEK